MNTVFRMICGDFRALSTGNGVKSMIRMDGFLPVESKLGARELLPLTIYFIYICNSVIKKISYTRNDVATSQKLKSENDTYLIYPRAHASYLLRL